MSTTIFNGQEAPSQFASHYISSEDDVPVTLQVGLVGSDGIVLAGDKQIITSSEYVTTSMASKIKVDSIKTVAVAWARHEIGETIANEILKNTKILKDETQLRDFIEKTYSEKSRDWRADSNLRSELLVAFQNPSWQLLYLDIHENHCTQRNIEEKMFSGHSASPACYFVERYYKRVAVKELVFLAAHTILEATELSDFHVKGLEIVTCTAAGIEVVTDKIEALKAQSKKFDKKIRKFLYEPF